MAGSALAFSHVFRFQLLWSQMLVPSPENPVSSGAAAGIMALALRADFSKPLLIVALLGLQHLAFAPDHAGQFFNQMLFSRARRKMLLG